MFGGIAAMVDEGSSDESPNMRNRRRQSLRAAFADAGRGLAAVLRTERNAKIHLLATVVVAAGGIGFKAKPIEWALLAIAVGGVWSAEAMNSSIERLADVASPNENPQIAHCKQAAAGGVLMAAITAIAIGLAVFLPKLLG